MKYNHSVNSDWLTRRSSFLVALGQPAGYANRYMRRAETSKV